MQPTADFCDHHNIEWFPIHVSINEGKKELCEIMHDLYKSIKCDNCKKYKNDCKCKEPKFYQTHKPDIHNFNDRLKERQLLFKKAPELFTHLSINTKNIFHIDIDVEDYEPEFDCIQNISPWFPSMSKSFGKHILCKYDGFVPSSSRMQFLNWNRPNEVELLCGIGSYAPFHIQNANCPFYDLKENHYKVKLDMPPVSKTKPQMSKTLAQSDKIKALCARIDNKYIVGKGTYDDWKSILWSLHSESAEYKEFARTMSDREGADYDEAKFEATWNAYNREKEKNGKKITIKTFYNYAKKSDPEFFAEIMHENNIRHCSNDTEASNLIFEELKGRLISDKGRIFYLKDNIWIADETKMRESVLYYIQNSNIYTTRNEKTGEYKPFVQNISKARNVLDTLLIKVGQENSDPQLYDKFHQTTKAKICFNDGVLDFKTKSFTLWSDIPHDKVKGTLNVYSTLKIDRNFDEYFKNCDRDVIDKIKDDILKPLYGMKMDRALHFLSRAIAGHYEDKRWATYLGNRNCGKGVEYDILSSAFGDYVSTFELGNLLYNRKSAGMENVECSKKLYWLMDLEFVRLAVSQEVPDTKSGLYINSKIMKKITGGGDEIVARRNFDRKDTHFRSDASYYIKGNSSLLLDSEDCDENRVEFESVVQFKSQDEIDKLKHQYDTEEMERFKIADHTIKDKCRSVEWCNAMIYLIYESYRNEGVAVVKHAEEEQDGMLATLKELFEFTKDDSPILVSEVVSLMRNFDKKKVEAELQSRNIFKKKLKKGEFRDKWVYCGIKTRPPKPLIDSDEVNDEIKDDELKDDELNAPNAPRNIP